MTYLIITLTALAVVSLALVAAPDRHPAPLPPGYTLIP